MRVIYDAIKGSRIKKGTYKAKNKYSKRNRFPILTSLECEDINRNTLWWSNDRKVWFVLENKVNGESFSNCNNNCNSLKSALRHVKKQDYLPKGTKFVLVSKFQGYDITIIK